MLSKVHYLLLRGESFSIETTLATRSLVGIIQQARKQEYKVMVIYLWLNSPELAIRRVKDRVDAGGHNIPDDVIRRRYHMGIQYLFETYIPLCDRWVLADNTKSPFTVVAEGNGKKVIIRDEEKYRTIRDISSKPL